MPNRDGSLKFAILGDFGTGSQTQYDLAKQMASVRQRFEYELVILVGDNIYGGERPQDFKKKFEEPVQAAPRRRREVLRGARQSRFA